MYPENYGFQSLQRLLMETLDTKIHNGTFWAFIEQIFDPLNFD